MRHGGAVYGLVHSGHNPVPVATTSFAPDADAHTGSAIARRLCARHGHAQLGRRAARPAGVGSRGTCPGVRVVVVDNASGDDSVAVAGGFRPGRGRRTEREHRVRPRQQPRAGRGVRAGGRAGQPRRGAARRLACGRWPPRPQRGPSGCSLRWCCIPTGRARTPCTRCRPARPTSSGRSSRRRSCRAARAPGWRRGGRRRRGGWAGRSGARSPPGPRRCGGWGRLTRRSSSTARTWSSACARAPAACRRGSGPRPGSVTTAPTPRRLAFGGEPFARLAAARHDVVRRRLGRRRAALDDALQALTFASRIAVKTALRRPARTRARPAAGAALARAGASAGP